MKMNKQKGFTIIELIVVIAIIAVLAAIVLVNVTGYIAQSKNTAIEGNLASILTNSAVFYDSATSYSGFTATTLYGQPAAGVTSNNGSITPTVSSDGSKFCVMSTLNTTTKDAANTTFCVDSSGNKLKKASGTCSAGVCN